MLVGFKPKLTIYASLVLMSILISGSSLIENWGAIETTAERVLRQAAGHFHSTVFRKFVLCRSLGIFG